METAKDPLEPSAPPSDARGLAVIAAIVVAVAGLLYSERPGDAPAPISASDHAALPGFRSDAWFLPDDDLLGFVEIPAGPFRMGSDSNVDPRAFENERWPVWSGASSGQGIVDLPVYYIGRYEVTVAQFRAFVEAAGFRADAQALAPGDLQPARFVSWPDALAYCRWLEARLESSPGTPPRLSRLLQDGWRVSLPSEAEWEKAARGTDGRIFPWGSEPRPDRANYGSSGSKPVGSFPCPECSFPLSDMSGNLWELTRSLYRPYPFEPTIDDVDLDRDALFVMRGGSYGDTDQNIRAAIRGRVDPGARRPFIGFRVVLTRIDP